MRKRRNVHRRYGSLGLLGCLLSIAVPEIARAQVESCTIRPSTPGPVQVGATATMTAVCTGSPVDYTWNSSLATCSPLTGNAQTASSTTCTFPAAGTGAIRLLAHYNSGCFSGCFATAAFDMQVTAPSAPIPVCTSLTANPSGPVAAGTPVTLTVNCTNNPTSFIWTANGAPAGTTTTPTLHVTPSRTTTYTVTASNAGGSAAVPQTVTVNVPSRVAAVSGTPQTGTPGLALAAPLVVLLTDANGNPVTGARTQLVAASTVTSDVLSAVSDVPGQPGRYQVTATLGASTATRNITICLSASPTECGVFTVTVQTAPVDDAARRVITPMEVAAINSATQQLSNINKWLDVQRTLRNPTVTQGLKVSVDGQALPPMSAFALAPTTKDGNAVAEKGGGASADRDPFEKWGFFVQGDVDLGKQSGTTTQTGFDIHTWGLTLGTDYRFVGNHVLGAALGLVKANSDLNDNAGNQDTKGWSLSVFGEYVPVENAYLDLALNYGWNRYDSTRFVGGAAPTARFDGSPNGNQFAAAFSAGYQFYQQAWTLNPYGRIEYVNAKIDSFQETGGAGALELSSQRYKRTVLTAGGQVQYAMSTSWGVLVPYARAEFQFATQTSNQQVTAQLVAIPASGQIIQLNGVDKQYGNLAVGATAVMPRGVSGYFNYQYLFGNGQFNDNRFSLGIRADF